MPSAALAIDYEDPKVVATALAQNPELVERELCQRSLFSFVQCFWDAVITETPRWNWHIAFFCHEIQTIIERAALGLPKKYDFLGNVPPGTTKSTITVQMAPAWAWAKWDWLRFICGSYSGNLSMEHGGLCRDIVRSDKYQRMFPKVKIRPDHDAKSNFRLVGGGQRYSTSVGGTVTGVHAHVIMVDDPLNPKEAVSDTLLQRANEWMDTTLSTRKVDKAITPTILIMQRLHENDPTGNLLAKYGKNIRHICLPGQCLDYEVKPSYLKDYYTDGLLDPSRMSWGVLAEMYLDLGDYAFAGQVGQKPSPPGGGLFKVDKLTINIVDTPPSPITYTVRYWDKAGTQDGGAYTAGTKMAALRDGGYLILDVHKGQWGPSKREAEIQRTAKDDGRDVYIYVEQEPGSGGKDSALATISGLAGYAAYADRPTGNKVYRADPLAAQINAGNVYMMRGSWNKPFVDELRVFPMGKFKDQVDSSSGAFARLVARTAKRVGALRSTREKR